MKNLPFVFFLALIILSFISCSNNQGSEEKKSDVQLKIEQEREERFRAQEEKEKKAAELNEKYKNNSLRTGATPYSYCYGTNAQCYGNGCSQISVYSPPNSDVLVTVKQNKKVISHAYIAANSGFTINVPNGQYQVFFYFGKGWNPEKEMKKSACGMLKGGFGFDESFSEDTEQNLNNQILTYKLSLQFNGNFLAQPSSMDDAL